MKSGTTVWFHEASVCIEESFTTFTRINSMNSPACDNLFMGVEKAIKATLVDLHGVLPNPYHHHRLVDLCRSAGVWGTLSSSLQSFVQTMCNYGPDARYPSEAAYQMLVSSSTAEEWEQRLAAAKELNGILQGWVLDAGGTIRPYPSSHPQSHHE